MNKAVDYPDEGWVRNVCKVGQGVVCCRYLTITGSGLSCEKHSPLRDLLDERVATKTITAQGDNCPGKDPRR